MTNYLSVGDFHHGIINRLERVIDREEAKMNEMSIKSGYTFEEWMSQAIFVTELMAVMDEMVRGMEGAISREFRN